MKMPRITGLDHIVLNVGDIEKSLAFYTGVLGLKGERVEEFRQGEASFPSVRINQHMLIDLNPVGGEGASGRSGEKVRRNLDHFCLVVEREDFPSLLDHLKNRDVPIRQGPVSRWGARGVATSVYFLDPEGNEIEIRCY